MLTLAAAGVASAQAQSDSALLFTAWEIQPATAPTGSRDLAGGEFVLKQKLLPLGLAELPGRVDIPELKLSLSAGTQLIAVGSGQQPLFCDITRYAKKANARAIACFADLDSDGSFEGYFKGLSMTGAILSLDGRVKFKNLKPITPLPDTALPPATRTCSSGFSGAITSISTAVSPSCWSTATNRIPKRSRSRSSSNPQKCPRI